eukprot:s662_g4.t1
MAISYFVHACPLAFFDRIMDYIEEVKACRPIPEVQACCYHHETRTRVVTKPDGSTKTEVYTERVDTATFTERLQVRRWADVSGEVVEGLSYFPLLQVHFELKWQAADDDTRRTHEQQQHRLRTRAANAATWAATQIGTTGETLPRWLGFWPYVVSSILGLSWPYRYWLAEHAVKGDFIFEKRVWSSAHFRRLYFTDCCRKKTSSAAVEAEKFENAVRALQEAQKEKVAAIEGANEQAREINREAKELDESRAKKQMRLQLMTESSKITDQSIFFFKGTYIRNCSDVTSNENADTKKKLDKESAVHQELALKRAKIDKELEELNAHNRHAQQEVTTLQKQLERMKRRYRQTLSHKDSVAETLPPLEVTKKDLEKSTKLQEEDREHFGKFRGWREVRDPWPNSTDEAIGAALQIPFSAYRSDIRRQRRLLEDIQAEVDLFIGAFLKQEMEEMQKELKDLKVEEQHWSQHFKTLASHREKLARDASQAHRLCRETADEVAMKELEEQDLKKKHQEISQKQKEFCTMYEVVKNERNKYMTHIQKSDQHLSEMKDGSDLVGRYLCFMIVEQRLQVIHDQLQNEKTRITAKGSALNEQVEQFVIEIDKLNSIISAIEKEMVLLTSFQGCS